MIIIHSQKVCDLCLCKTVISVESLLFYIITIQSHAFYEPFKTVKFILKIEFMFKAHDLSFVICHLPFAICDDHEENYKFECILFL